ncbi:ComEC/Rec2 family competence protein [Citricoccus sp.]|uniref:ComEC/Rec2 family competence protein n=1 Tax=Citricoccus sp. TaxID=1978372 RepID=UPI0028BDDB49|nr:ComEC/Rec2 family competence protein [Citricoccus sp.]
MQARGRVPAAVDLRLVPAVVLTLAVCLAIPLIPYDAALLVPWVLAVLALGATGLMMWASAGRGPDQGQSQAQSQGQARRRGRTTAITALAAIALWVAAVAAVQAVGDRAPVWGSGWEDAVAAERPLRLSGEAAGPAVLRTGTFGDSWHLTVTVQAFGHPSRELPGGAEVVVSGGQDWDRLPAGTAVCFTAAPEAEGATVFARASTAPQTGSCTSDAGAPGPNGAPTGRDIVRVAVHQAAAGTVGTAPQLLPGLILGDRSAQEPELDESMKTSGLSHLSAVSGANCTLIAGAVTMALRSVRIRRPVVLGAVLGVLFVFVIVVGPEPSVIRAAVMGALGAWAVFFGRGRQALPLLCLAASVLLCWQPGLAGEPAFQLSLAATAGIVLAARPVEQWLTAVLRRVLPGPVAGILGAALAVTVTAQVACQPILVGMTGEFSAYSVPANLLAAPLVPFVTVPGTFAAVLAVPWPGLAAAVFWVVGWPAAGIGWIASEVSGWPGALHAWPEGPLGAGLVLMHVAAALALLWLLMRWERSRPARVRRLGPHGRPRPAPAGHLRWSLAAAWTTVCAAAGSQLGLVIAPPSGSLPADWSLVACDVGQGDMLVLRTGERAAMVVDTGPEPTAATGCLDGIGVDRVDLLVLSHLHEDHAGAAADIIGCCSPTEVLYSTMESSPGPGLPAGARQPVPGETGRAGDWPASGYGVDWAVLEADPGAANENDASLQMTATVHTPEGDYTVLLTGDMEEEASRALLGRDVLPDSVDVLKVAHHGARNGGLDVVRAVGPALSVVQVGRDNGYGHPHPSVIGELERHGPVIRTDLHGTTVVSLRDGALVPTLTGARAPEAAGTRSAGGDG